MPLHYERNYAYPLLVWLHGPEDDRTQLKRVMPHISLRNYVAVAPTAPQVDAALQHCGDWEQQPASILEAMECVQECIAAATERFHINPSRVFLAGYDVGGTMAIRLAMAAPHSFAGVASLGGPFPQGFSPLVNLASIRRLPFLIAHARDSQQYQVDRLCDELRLFHVAGMSLTLRQYPCGHELTTQMLADLNAWAMQLVTGENASGQTHSYLPRDGHN